jgi:hypothetical protein
MNRSSTVVCLLSHNMGPTNVQTGNGNPSVCRDRENPILLIPCVQPTACFLSAIIGIKHVEDGRAVRHADERLRGIAHAACALTTPVTPGFQGLFFTCTALELSLSA